MLEVKDIEVCYGKVQVLWGVSLKVREGEIVVVIGPNGAGKSTILKTIAGILRPRSGSIHLREKRIDGIPPYKVSSLGIALVPEGRELFPRMSVYENLLLGAYLQRDEAAIQDTLDWVYSLFPVLKEREGQMAGTLSGGEQQMLAIGRALMSKSSLLMLDEPSAGLAPILARRALESVEKLSSEGITILLVEQNIHHSLEMADRGYVLEGGRVVMEGLGDELLKDPSVKTAYLGV